MLDSSRSGNVTERPRTTFRDDLALHRTIYRPYIVESPLENAGNSAAQALQKSLRASCSISNNITAALAAALVEAIAIFLGDLAVRASPVSDSNLARSEVALHARNSAAFTKRIDELPIRSIGDPTYI
jgi:hypothetical protein